MPQTPRDRLRIYFGRAPSPAEPDPQSGPRRPLLVGLIAGVLFAVAWGTIGGDWAAAIVVGVAFAVGIVVLDAVDRRRRR